MCYRGNGRFEPKGRRVDIDCIFGRCHSGGIGWEVVQMECGFMLRHAGYVEGAGLRRRGLDCEQSFWCDRPVDIRVMVAL